MADFTAADRRKLASKGEAMPSGAYPIRNTTDLANAVKDWIRTGRSGAVKAHIIKRARALGAELPESMEPKGIPDEVETAKTMTRKG